MDPPRGCRAPPSSRRGTRPNAPSTRSTPVPRRRCPGGRTPCQCPGTASSARVRPPARGSDPGRPGRTQTAGAQPSAASRWRGRPDIRVRRVPTAVAGTARRASAVLRHRPHRPLLRAARRRSRATPTPCRTPRTARGRSSRSPRCNRRSRDRRPRAQPRQPGTGSTERMRAASHRSRQPAAPASPQSTPGRRCSARASLRPCGKGGRPRRAVLVAVKLAPVRPR